jgi:RNA polymerase sigma factor (sigma-70 family)
MNNAALLESPKVKDAIRRAANKYANDPHDAEDIAQECRMYIFEKLTDEEAQKPPYIYRSCWSRACRHLRDAETRAKYINYLFASAEAEAEERNYDEILSDFLGGLHPSDSIELEIENREELEIIRTIANTLTVKQERIFWLRMEGLSARKIARRLGMHYSTIEDHLKHIMGIFQAHRLSTQLFTNPI